MKKIYLVLPLAAALFCALLAASPATLAQARKAKPTPEEVRAQLGKDVSDSIAGYRKSDPGMERFFKVLPSTSVEFSIIGHYVSAVRDDQFATGWNSNLGAAGIRVGANYYFDLERAKKAQELPASGGGK